jgi:hypothetical membrane protein
VVATRGAPSMGQGVRQTKGRREQERGSRTYDRPIYRKAAGALLFLAGAVILMGIITAEVLYPADYSTAGNTVSDLGGTRPSEGGVVLQPSATVFDATMVVSGVMIVAAAYGLHRAFGRRAVTIPTGLLGLGVLGVGIFPGNTGLHPIFALLAFVSGGVAAILSYKVSVSPLRYVVVVLGAIALLMLVLGILGAPQPDGMGLLGNEGPIVALGPGGLERWVAYPVVLWLTAFGGYLMGPMRSQRPVT